MAEKPEDLNLPNSVVFRIIKEAIPPGMNVSKDVRLAISKAASVFVLYCTATANAVAQASNRKTLSGPDVLNAMEEMEFEEFLPAIREFLQEYKKTTENKKQRKTVSPKEKPQPPSKPNTVSPKQKMSPVKKKSPVKEVGISYEDSDEEFAKPTAVKGKPGRPSKESKMDVDESGDSSSDVVLLD